MSNGRKRLFNNFPVISESGEQSITSHRDLPNSLSEDSRLDRRGQATTSEHRRLEGKEQETPKSFRPQVPPWSTTGSGSCSACNISINLDKSLPLPGLHFFQCEMRESAYLCGLQPWNPQGASKNGDVQVPPQIN